MGQILQSRAVKLTGNLEMKMKKLKLRQLSSREHQIRYLTPSLQS